MDVFSAILAFFGMSGPSPPPPPPRPAYVVKLAEIADEKSVFATVEPINTVPARVRTGGTIASLAVTQGDWVEKGQLIAVVGDRKLALQAGSYQAQVTAARAQFSQAKMDYDRAVRLIGEKAISRSSFDAARTAFEVARSNVNALNAQKAVVEQQSEEGQVLSPTAGRVITVPVTAGSVVVSGDTVATVAEQNFVLRLKLPETHAHVLKVGMPVHLDGADIGLDGPRTGKVRKLYPDIDAGHVVADAEVEGLTDYFVGERVRVMVPVGRRKAILVPEALIVTRSGIDYARIVLANGTILCVPIQRGQSWAWGAHKGKLEVLSGLHPGDRMLKP